MDGPQTDDLQQISPILPQNRPNPRTALRSLGCEQDSLGRSGGATRKNQRIRDRRRTEAQKLQAVKSPYVVQIHEFFTEEGIGQVLVMEYCPVGLDKHLRQRFAQTNGHLPYNEAREILESVLSGLNDAHSVDIVHGDIKPANCRSLGARPDHRRRLPLSRRHRTRLHRSVSRSLRMSKPRMKRRVNYFSFSIGPTMPWPVLTECLTKSIGINSKTAISTCWRTVGRLRVSSAMRRPATTKR